MRFYLSRCVSALPVLWAYEAGYFRDNGIDAEIKILDSYNSIEAALQDGRADAGEFFFSAYLLKANTVGSHNLLYFPAMFLNLSELVFYTDKNLFKQSKDYTPKMILPVPHEGSPCCLYAKTMIRKFFGDVNEAPVSVMEMPYHMYEQIYSSEHCFGLVADNLIFPFITSPPHIHKLKEVDKVPGSVLCFSDRFILQNREKVVQIIEAVKKSITLLSNSNPINESFFLGIIQKYQIPYLQKADTKLLREKFPEFFCFEVPDFCIEDLIFLLNQEHPENKNIKNLTRSIIIMMDNILDQSVPVQRLIKKVPVLKVTENNEEKDQFSFFEKKYGKHVRNFGYSFYKALFTDSSELMLFFDRKTGRIIDANTRFKEELGYSEEIERLTIYDVIKDCDENHPLHSFMQKAGETNYISNLELLHKNRHDLSADLYISPLIFAEKVFYLCVFINNSENKEAMRLRHEFISNISHELRSPMTSIRGFFELISTDANLNFNDEHRNVLNIIEKNILKMIALIDNLLQLDKKDRLLETKIIEKFDPASVIEEIIMINEPLAKGKGLSIRKSLMPGLIMETDKIDFSQIISNLVGNAIKYTEKGHIKVTMMQESRNVCMIKVEDTGIGIPKKYQHSIFERFFRVPGESNKRIGGTGLGLAIVEELLNRSGGIITVNSKVGEGTSFLVYLPLLKEKEQIKQK
ncbi:MAG TPA: ATP-binding protein [Leptospiraceae bacterium]|nr:ATP-binding protein [Leptospiraceae bacterium]HMY67412.1 ATP-binding protein [Leptospiraceae bacterium]HNF14296.1 ATP-binding protein [Leptospiraceae bacterium]HNF26384.1 ATP-binding protein [Leptospiraceae bacterium]HNI97857.1 ATP-binding protein [Leptospiraceae bacterium]